MGDTAPPLAASTPLSPPGSSLDKSGSLRRVLAGLLSLCLAIFLADAIVSLLDDSLILCFGVHLFTSIRTLVGLVTLLVALLIYCLMGLTPMIPKRLFLPLTLFGPAGMLLVFLLLIYYYDRIQQLAWALSLCQLILGLGILYCVQGGIKLRWPLVPENHLESRRFSWLNLSAFMLVNLFLVLPAGVIYLVMCAVLAVDHFSEGFLALRPRGLTVQVRTYHRDDAKTIQLVPMSHVGEPDFYRKLSQSFPADSVILMEGVTDNQNLLTNQITYHRMATSLGLAEQEQEFNPSRGELVMADVDVDQFNTNTIGFLNLVMRLHSKGVTPETILQIIRFTPPPHFEEQLFADLLGKRNRHLLQEIQARLPQADNLIVPWGVAHMPEIAREIQKSGFRLSQTQEYVTIRFGPSPRTAKRPVGKRDSGQPK